MEKQESTKKHLIKASGMMGIMTLASRVLGMIRDIVSAKAFGTTWQWDAFVFAFMMPNFLRRVVAEGSLTSAFIPIYSELLEKENQERAFRFGNLIMTLMGVVILGFILVLQIVFQILLTLKVLPPHLHFTVDLLRFMFPYLWFICMYAIGMGILNCHRRFFASSIGPVILDLLWICGVIWLVPRAGGLPQDQLRVLSWAIVFSGVLQVAAEIPSLRRIGFHYHWVWDLKDEAIRKAWKLVLPSMMTFGIVQVNLFVDQLLGLTIGSGANSSLWYGSRLMQFPLGVFGIAMGTALLPTISRQIAAGKKEEARNSISFAMRSIFLIIIPCTVGMMVMSRPIIQLLFQRGEFNAASTSRTASVLICYCIGLFAYAGQKIILAGFYASQDTRTPVKIGLLDVLINFTLNITLMQFMRESGLALATSIAAIIEFFLLIHFYEKKIDPFPHQEVWKSFGRITLASLVMGVVCAVLYSVLGMIWPSLHLRDQLLRTGVTISFAAFAYVGFCFLFRVREIGEAWAWIRKNRNKETRSKKQEGDCS
ncbi:MAG: murein biosynthesis integral membrane protein MurJ [Candidatus Omnitrophica bacterium]|nr:murein biosynthesis integral membrane protein MurJ [Candidatus Omnitrophota bacterium]